MRNLGRTSPDDLPMPDVERDARYSSMPWFDRLLRALNLGQRLELLLYQAGMDVRSGVLVLVIAVFAIGGYFVGLLFFHRIMVGLVSMLLIGPLPLGYVNFRKNQRMRAFAQEFPDALDLLVSALRAGLSFSAAMQVVSEESPEPVRSEFAITVEEQALGLDMRETLGNLAQRVDSLDLRFFVTAVLLQKDSGGNLAEVLTNTSHLIRERFRVLGDIKTFTAHGKLTGMVLAMLPIGVSIFTWMMAPDYFRPMIETDGGKFMLAGAVFMQVLGVLVIRKVVQIKV
jgi:tight adherence protein B